MRRENTENHLLPGENRRSRGREPGMREYFSTRWDLVAAALGMAIGAGNIWRFPRVAAYNGGGAFLVAWMTALFIWSIPILIIEFSLGRSARRGVIGAFASLPGRRLTWMGFFVAACTTAIMFYYSVVTGWCMRYILAPLQIERITSDSDGFWRDFTSSFLPVAFHLLAFGITGAIVYRGIVRGIQRANRVLIPSLFFLLILAAARVLFLPGAFRGLEFLFHPRWGDLLQSRIWLEALSQSAWSAGPGWGLFLTYAVYSRREEDPTAVSVMTGLGNNFASILAGITVLGTLFAFLPEPEALQAARSGNSGLAFIWLPRLFANMPAGKGFMFLFFSAMTFAALSSLISMVEMVVRILVDFGLTRERSVLCVALVGFLSGLPSALNMNFFNNQDWVWGLGLILSGFFLAVAANAAGVKRFRREFVSLPGRKPAVGGWFDFTVRFLIPVEFAGLILWWYLPRPVDRGPGRRLVSQPHRFPQTQGLKFHVGQTDLPAVEKQPARHTRERSEGTVRQKIHPVREKG